jgi:hypothetical protein
LDNPAVWELLNERYDGLFKIMSGLDGVILTFHETEIKVYDVESELPSAERIAKLINNLYATLKRHGKTLVVRTFSYEPHEVESISEAYRMIDPEVVLMSKCVPHDWEVFYPHNLAIGQYPERKQIIEFDPGGEFYGKGHVPYLYPEYLDFRIKYARDRNAYGYVARVERQGNNPCAIRNISSESGWNEINLYALKRFAEDPSVTPEQVWNEYVTQRVGDGPYIKPLIDALKLTDDVLNRCYFMLGCWYNNHSTLPSQTYAESHIPQIAKWNSQYKELVDRLTRPDARAVGEVFRESKESVLLAELALNKLEDARKAGLPKEHYDFYKNQMSALFITSEKWAKHRNSYIQTRAKGTEPVYDGQFPVGGPPRLYGELKHLE